MLSLAPLLIALRRNRTPRGRRETALTLHRAQLVELDRDLEDGRIDADAHKAARLEVQRRLLAAGALADEAISSTRRLPLIITAILVPLAAEGLYLINGQPGLPSAHAVSAAETAQQDADATQLITTLRARLADMDPKDPITAQGYVLLGNAEAGRDHLKEAAQAWTRALEAGFDPGLAAQAAEAQLRVDGKMTDQTRALFERALAEAPPDAPWKNLVQQRLAGVLP